MASLQTSAAARLLAARATSTAIPSRDLQPADRDAAYAIQHETLLGLGAIGGWKVGAKGPDAEPNCAPLPAAGVLATGARLTGPAWSLRGIEVEVGLRLGRDIDPGGRMLSPQELWPAIECVLPVIEVVETRLADWREADPLAKLADLQSHGALVLGPPSGVAPEEVDLRHVEAYLSFDGQPVATTVGANPAQDLWRLLAWLAVHCSARGVPLKAGQVVITGSCTGMLFAPEGAKVQGQLARIGRVGLQF